MVGKDVTVKDITRGIYLSQRDAVSEGFTEEADDVGTTKDSAYIEYANDGKP